MYTMSNQIIPGKVHHEYGPSTLTALSLCVRFKYSNCDDDAASEGTFMHAAFETGNFSGLTDEQQQCVTAARNYCESLKYEGGADPSMWEDRAELKVNLRGLTYGTADRVLFCPSTGLLHIIDFKSTRAHSSHALQLKTYGAAYAEYLNSATPDAVRTVVTHVVAPRLGPVEPESFSAAELIADVRAYLEALYARIEDPFEPPTPHEDVCAKCARAARCPALGKVVVRASLDLGLPLPETFAPSSLVSERDRAVAQVLASVFSNWSEQVKENNTAFVKGGGEIPGYRIATRSLGMRVPKENTRRAIEALEKKLEISLVSALSCCSMTLGDVIKLVAFERGLTEAEAKECVRDALSETIVEGSCTFLQKEKRIADGALLGQLVGGKP